MERWNIYVFKPSNPLTQTLLDDINHSPMAIIWSYIEGANETFDEADAIQTNHDNYTLIHNRKFIM